jgi:hypothetical protein
MLKNFIGITAIIFNKFKYYTIFALNYYSNKIGIDNFLINKKNDDFS